jgi:hypothetical protein
LVFYEFSETLNRPVHQILCALKRISNESIFPKTALPFQAGFQILGYLSDTSGFCADPIARTGTRLSRQNGHHLPAVHDTVRDRSTRHVCGKIVGACNQRAGGIGPILHIGNAILMRTGISSILLGLREVLVNVPQPLIPFPAFSFSAFTAGDTLFDLGWRPLSTSVRPDPGHRTSHPAHSATVAAEKLP